MSVFETIERKLLIYSISVVKMKLPCMSSSVAKNMISAVEEKKLEKFVGCGVR
jgi:hypothetical protein